MHIPFIKGINVFLVFCLLVCSPIISKEILSEQSLQGLNKYINEAMKDWNVPGLAVRIVKDGKVILSEEFGFGDIKNNLKVTFKTHKPSLSLEKYRTLKILGMESF
jgi:CubicO group peptidase (beta-lactamase class C family)